MRWFLRRGEALEGPYPEEDVRAWLKTGQIAETCLLGPREDRLHPAAQWRAFAASGHLSAEQFDGQGTQVLATDAEVQAPAAHASELAGTQIMGAPSGVTEPPEQPWPGYQQEDPSSQPAPARSAPPPPQVSPPPPSPAEQHELYVPRVEPRQNAPSFVPAPPPRESLGPAPEPLALPATPSSPAPPDEASVQPKRAAPYRGIEYTARPQLPPVRSSWGLPHLVAAGSAALLICTGAIAGADRLINGASTSDISEHLPAGSAWYVEIPSIKRLARGASRAEFVNWEKLGGEPFAELAQEFEELNDDEPLAQALSSVSSIGACEVDGEPLLAFQLDDSDGMEAFLRSDKITLGKKSDLGVRFTFDEGAAHCLWDVNDTVTLCGTKGSLREAEEVLLGHVSPASEDDNLTAAKTRSWSSYLPFSDRPVIYAVSTAGLLDDLPIDLPGFGGATLQGRLNEGGFIEKLDALFVGGGVFEPPGPLTLADQLPVGTLMYTNYRLKWPSTEEELNEFTATVDPEALPPGAPSINGVLGQMERHLGMTVPELGQMLGPEALFAVTADPKVRLSDEKAFENGAAFWFVQEVTDERGIKKLLKELAKQLPEDIRHQWDSQGDLLIRKPGNFEAHIRITKKHLRLIGGAPAELKRIEREKNKLSSDGAHQTARIQVDDQASAVVWIDAARLLKAERLDTDSRDRKQAERFRRALVTEGDERLTVAAGFRQFPDGPVRLRTVNLPVGLGLMSAAFLGHLQALVEDRPAQPHQ